MCYLAGCSIRVVKITVPEEKPAPKEEPSRKKASAFGTVLKVAGVVSAAALIIAAGLLFLRLQPLSKAYSLIISSPSFALRVGEENQISYSFRQATDVPLMLRPEDLLI